MNIPSKDYTLLDSTRIQMNIIHSRRNNEIKHKRTFNIVINNLLLSTVLFSSLALSGCQVSKGVENNAINNPPVAVEKQMKEEVRTVSNEDEAILLNLDLAIKAIQDLVSKGQWKENMFNNLYYTLEKIEGKLNNNTLNVPTEEVKKSIIRTDVAFTEIERIKVPANIQKSTSSKYYASKSTLNRIKIKLGLDTDNLLANNTSQVNVVNTSTNSSESSNISSNIKVQSYNSSKSDEVKTQQKQQTTSSTKEQTPDKYKGYTKVSARLKTVNSNNTIYVKYGKHTYGAFTQEEYDITLARVEEAIKRVKATMKPSLALELAREGKKSKDYSKTDPKECETYALLNGFEKTFGYFVFVTDKIDPDITDKYLLANAVWRDLSKNAKDPETGAPNSAFDVIVNCIGDCDSYAHLEMAIWDSLGFNCRLIQTSPTHAVAHVRVAGGTWWTSTGTQVNQKQSESTVLVGPTYN